VIAGLALLAGVLLGLGSARIPAAPWMIGAALCVVVSLTCVRRRAAVRALAALLAGLLLSTCSSGRWLERRVEPHGADERVLLEGRVLTVPARHGVELRFDAEVRMPAADDSRARRARLLWREPAVVPRVGETWRWLVRLAPLAETRNFTGADLERIAFRDGVHLSGRVLPSRLNERHALAPASIDTARARIAARIDAAVGDPDAAALISALAVGLTDRMSLDQWRVFNATGTTHLVAISGLHVTLFALLAFACARRLWAWLPLRQHHGREPFAVLAALGAAGAYSLLAGLSIPTQRTWLMLAVFAAARLAGRHIGALRSWSLALVAVLLMEPAAPLAAGFWLSFVAVGVLFVATSAPLAPPGGRAGRVASLFRLQLAVMAALAPLTFAVFDAVSLAGLGVNLVAIPVISFVFVPVILAGAACALWLPSAGAMCFSAAGMLYEWMWPALVWVADLDLAQWRATPPLGWYLAALPAVAVGLLRWPLALRVGALCALLPLLPAGTAARMPERGTARVIVLDAGRGAAVLVVTHSRVLLFDTGDSWNTAGVRARQLVLPALAALGDPPVDPLVLPTLTPDRAAGAALLAHEHGVRRVLVGGGWPGSSLPVMPCRDAVERRDGLTFEWFAAGSRGRSCVLRIVTGSHSLLLGGDLDVDAERDLLARLPRGSFAGDVTVLSRQASAVGSSPQWIEASGRGLLIATGGIEHSRSRATALERWRERDVRVLDTRREGAIEIIIGTRGIESVACARTLYPFVWRRLPGMIRHHVGNR
jgi:competence protein ComEC